MKMRLLLLLMCMPWMVRAYEHHDETYAARCKECIGLTFFADGLYWQAYEDGLDYAIQNNAGAVRINDGTVRRLNFDWHGGFRAGAGYCTPCGNYQFNAFWTRFHTKANDCLNVSLPTTLFPVWTNPSSALTSEQSAKATASLHIDMFDARLTALLTPHCTIDVMPFLGLVYARVDQCFIINVSGGQSNGPFAKVLDNVIYMENNFSGVGPKIGMQSIWALGCGFGAFSRVSAALAYGKFNIQQKETVTFSNNVPETTFLNVPCNRFHTVRPIIDLTLGARWEAPRNRDAFCCQSRYHLYLEAGWELMYLFGQNMLMRFTDDINPGTNLELHGDLATQGVTFRVGFTF